MEITHPLLTPRYMVEAECPFLTWGEGAVLIPAEDGEMYSKEHGYSPSNQKLFLSDMPKYPKIFRHMHWSEGRELSEMPRWVRVNLYTKNRIYPVEYSVSDGHLFIRAVGDIEWSGVEDLCNDWGLTPATEAEYLEYLKSKEK